MSNTTRNLVIFTAVSLSAGFVGIAVDRLNPPANPAQGLGALIWLASPLLTGLLLRAFGGDGWRDFGLKPNLKHGWRWYLVALLIVPLVTLVILILGFIVGTTDLSGLAAQGLGTFLGAAGVTFVGVMVKNIFEEFAWRGYLTPRFDSLRLHPLTNATLTGFIWAGWHIPYYLYYLDRETLTAHTPLNLSVFILLSFLVLPFHALAYGELRLISGSVWPSWLLHNVANAISLTLVSGGFMVLPRSFAGVLFSPGTEGIFSSLLMGVVGVVLYRHRQKQSQTAAQPALRSIA